ncbi:hypothetical protein BpHYR1_049945 [Brachionus plicatilis]|uniref:Uncharacterized protein n=1 Tax=Brachionus plicatilis TaxID=10195 RepID=A0A3M7RWH3_BRAPC|nr:hypothetical protein BpHYR1_049945 [Brachionus plicatilis]
MSSSNSLHSFAHKLFNQLNDEQRIITKRLGFPQFIFLNKYVFNGVNLPISINIKFDTTPKSYKN